MANSTSTRRIRMLSTRPPIQPATAPTTTPTKPAMSIENRPTAIEMRAPLMTIANTSRPSRSVPKMCVADGGSPPGLVAPGKNSGSKGTTIGPEDGDEQHDDEDGQADQGQPVAQEAPPRELPLAEGLERDLVGPGPPGQRVPASPATRGPAGPRSRSWMRSATPFLACRGSIADVI